MYVGLHELINAQTTNIQVSRAIPHEHFDEITGINDLMLLQVNMNPPLCYVCTL